LGKAEEGWFRTMCECCERCVFIHGRITGVLDVSTRGAQGVGVCGPRSKDGLPALFCLRTSGEIGVYHDIPMPLSSPTRLISNGSFFGERWPLLGSETRDLCHPHLGNTFHAYIHMARSPSCRRIPHSTTYHSRHTTRQAQGNQDSR